MKWQVVLGQSHGDLSSPPPLSHLLELVGVGQKEQRGPVSSEGALSLQDRRSLSDMRRDSRSCRQSEDHEGGFQAPATLVGAAETDTLPKGVCCPQRASARGRVTSLALSKPPNCQWRASCRGQWKGCWRTSGRRTRGVKEGCPVVPKIPSREVSAVLGLGALVDPRTLSGMCQVALTQDLLVLWAGQAQMSSQRR